MKEFHTPIQVRYADNDMMGHVNSAVYFSYIEMARVQIMLDLWRDRSFDAVVARQSCDYRKPIFLTDEVTVSTRFANLGNTSFELRYRLHDGKGKTFAEAMTVMVCFDRESQRPVQVPECVRQWVES